MKKFAYAVTAAIALVSVSACADDYYGYGYGSPYYYDGYYDGYYGPAYRGYWGGDGFFYYQSGRGRPFVRDDGRHFRRDNYQGSRSFHMRGPPQQQGGPHWEGHHPTH